jgi:hypothetical protein
MTRKIQCPACRAMTTEQTEAFDQGDPCPSCGLAHSYWLEVLKVRENHVESELRSRVEELLVANGTLEAENEGLRAAVSRAAAILEVEIHG